MGAPLLWPSDLMQKPVLQQQHLQAPAVLGETAGTAWLVFMACSPSLSNSKPSQIFPAKLCWGSLPEAEVSQSTDALSLDGGVGKKAA